MGSNINAKVQETAKQQRQLFGSRLRALRKSAGLKQQQLAERSGFTASVIARYEAGGSLPRPQAMKKLAAALGVSVADLDGSNFDLDLNVLLSKHIEARLKKFNIQVEFTDKIKTVTLSGPDIDNKTMSFDDLRKVIEKTEKETNLLLAPLFDKYFSNLLKVNLEIPSSETIDEFSKGKSPEAVEAIEKIKKVFEITKASE